MKEKILKVKKLKTINFNDLRCLEKNLMYYCKSSSELPDTIYLGTVKLSDFKILYLESLTFKDASLHPSQLEKQTIFGRDYFIQDFSYEMPFKDCKTNRIYLNLEKDVFFELKDNINVQELRNIANKRDTKLIIKE